MQQGGHQCEKKDQGGFQKFGEEIVFLHILPPQTQRTTGEKSIPKETNLSQTRISKNQARYFPKGTHFIVT